MRRPRPVVGLVARPGAHPEADGHRARVGHRLGDQADARIEQGADHGSRAGDPSPAVNGAAVRRGAGDAVAGRRPGRARPSSARAEVPPGRGRRARPRARPRRRPRRTRHGRRRAAGAPSRPSRSRRRSRSVLRRPDRWSPPAPGRLAVGAPASESDTLPCGSMSSTSTSTAWPRVSTSSTRSTRLPPARAWRCAAGRHGRGGC